MKIFKCKMGDLIYYRHKDLIHEAKYGLLFKIEKIKRNAASGWCARINKKTGKLHEMDADLFTGAAIHYRNDSFDLTIGRDELEGFRQATENEKTYWEKEIMPQIILRKL